MRTAPYAATKEARTSTRAGAENAGDAAFVIVCPMIERAHTSFLRGADRRRREFLGNVLDPSDEDSELILCPQDVGREAQLCVMVLKGRTDRPEFKDQALGMNAD